ncbi:hypothetical protein SLEP1_g2244 [Rubroshorea leprosula]|uniref:Uncharacterized protein n=1 Tax=Rubroshorea leprosula TaxID=152421 RepID=A0AAV5HQ90_9ROSI|nr:hypothetical protein SLEP1_g2244 [Rubroshorea leprosula]
MASDLEKESLSELKLPLFSISNTHLRMQSPERSGASTPPSASVPFHWEEEPGKPKPCTALSTFTIPDDFAKKCLELPPRLLVDAKQYSSPTTVLEGPYIGWSSRFQSFRIAKNSSPSTQLLDGSTYIGRSSRFQSYSFRMGGQCYGSFRATGDSSPEPALPYESLTVSKKSQKEKGNILGFWRRRTLTCRKEVAGGSYIFPSSEDKENDSGRQGEDISRSTTVKITTIRRMGSSANLPHARAHFWANIYEGLKQAVPWKNRRVKKEKEGLMS